MFEVSGYSYSAQIPTVEPRTMLVHAGMLRARLNHHDFFIGYAAQRSDNELVKTRISGAVGRTPEQRVALRQKRQAWTSGVRPGLELPKKQVPKSEIKGWS